jgi:hypothetical protein
MSGTVPSWALSVLFCHQSQTGLRKGQPLPYQHQTAPLPIGTPARGIQKNCSPVVQNEILIPVTRSYNISVRLEYDIVFYVYYIAPMAFTMSAKTASRF